MTTNRRIARELVEALPAGSTAWDTEVMGFGVRRQRRDAVYLVKYRDAGGRQRVVTIGRHGPGEWSPDRARKEAIRIRGLVRDGQDVATERDAARAAPTVSEFASRYMADYALPHKKPRSVEEDCRLLRLRILPVLGQIKLRDLGRAEVARLHAAGSKTPVAANRALALVSGMCGWAETIGERPEHSNPCRRIARFPEKSRERMLASEELARLGDALTRAGAGWTEHSKDEWRYHLERQADETGVAPSQRPVWIAARMPTRDAAEDWRAIACYRLLLLSGARLNEILTLRWSWIDNERGVARLPDSKTGAKNLYFAAGAMAVLKVLPRFAGNPYVLPGDRPGGHFIGIQKPWQRVRALAGLDDLRLHDLRHGFASTAVAAGDSLFIVGKLLGHRNASTTQRYSHLAPDPVRAVASRTAERLADLLAGRKGPD